MAHTTATTISIVLAHYTAARSMVGYWHDIVVVCEGACDEVIEVHYG